MLAIFQVDESGVFVVLVTIKDEFRQLVFVTHTAKRGTHLPTKSNATMATWETFTAWLITAGAIAKLVTLLRTSIMVTFPIARLNTINARLAALLTTPAVSATVFARFLTRWTGNSAIYITAMAANQGTSTFFCASFMKTAVETLSTRTFTRMFTSQCGLATLRT